MAEVDAGAVAPVVPVAPAAEAVPTPDPTAGQAVAPEGEIKPEAPPRTFTQEELDKIVQEQKAKASRKADRETRAELERRVRAETEAEFLRKQIEGRKPDVQPKGKPSPKDFESPEDYVEALTDWKLEQRETAREQKARETRQTEGVRESIAEMRSALFQGADEFEDFEDVVFAPNVKITQAMGIAVTETKAPARLAYHLATNPAEAARIAALPTTRQAYEVHVLAEKLAAAPKPTNTPPPIVPNSGKGKVEKDIYDPNLTDAEFNAIRRRQSAQSR